MLFTSIVMKIEENIKEKFRNREINPSPQAWDRVAAQLKEEQRQKKGTKFYKLAIAAGFVGILLVSSLFLFKNSTASNPIVSAPEHFGPAENFQRLTHIDQDKNDSDTDSLQQVTAQEQVSLQHKNLEKRIDVPLEGEKYNITQTKIEPVAMQAKVADSIDAAVMELLASVTEAEQEGISVSDEVIENLLAEARAKIVREHSFAQKSASITATALLEDVEAELDPSFRDRVFYALKEGFQKAREALVSRNQ